MKHLALLAAVYALIAALVLPSSLLAPMPPTRPPRTLPRARRRQQRRPGRAPGAGNPRGSASPTARARRHPPEQLAAAPDRGRRTGPSGASPPASARRSRAPGCRQRHRDDRDFQFAPAQITINQGTRSRGRTTARRRTRPRHPMGASTPASSRRAEPIAHLQRRRHVLLHLHAPPEHARHDRRAGLSAWRRHARLERG